MSSDDDLLKEAKDTFARAESAETDNRKTYLDDSRFAREGIQWPDKIRDQRGKEGRPVLTINKMPAFIRQVVNDARQNKPSIKVHPVDSGADPETADVINGLIRNIESASDADVAYDTATECAVTGGFGYLRIVADYAYTESFEQDLMIRRIANPLSVYGDPYSTAADSSDWNDAFIVDQISEEQFKADYKGKAATDFDSSAWSQAGSSWRNVADKTVTKAEWWKRREEEETILQLSGGRIITKTRFLASPDLQAMFDAGALKVENERKGKCYKVTQRIMSGVEILDTREWPGKFIPIVPVYGDEFDIEGKRFWRSLIHNAIDAQRMFNYWRTTSTELVALAPKVPFIGPVGAFNTDPNWQSANTKSHPYLEYDPVGNAQAPMRQNMDGGVAAGALQEALNASDDMKGIIGLYDASLGARSNETSGKAIMARQREGDVATFHFIDNMARAIRHTGRIILDLIPHYYTTERVVRIIGEDGKPETKKINGEYPMTDPKTGEPITEEAVDEQGQKIQRVVMAMHDLRVGKYDLTVSTGPSFTTRREEAAYSMTEALRAYPEGAPVIMPELAKNLDWPGADKIAEKLEAQGQPAQIPPEVQQQIEEGMARMQELEAENQQLKTDQSAEMAKVESTKQIELLKIASNKEIKMAEIASDREIALIKAQADVGLAKYKADQMAEIAANKPAPQRNGSGQSAR